MGVINLEERLGLGKYISNSLKVIFLVDILQNDNGWVKISGIREELSIKYESRSQLTTIINSLEEDGLIKRNNVSYEIKLTQKGSADLKLFLTFLNDLNSKHKINFKSNVIPRNKLISS